VSLAEALNIEALNIEALNVRGAAWSTTQPDRSPVFRPARR
jgi:hypothetical protein